MELNRLNFNNNFNKINFQKKLIAKTYPVDKNNKVSQYKFYQLEPDKDTDYFTNVINDWQDGILLLDTLSNFHECSKYHKFYVIEDENKKCLGYAQINLPKNSKDIELVNLETKPSLAHRNNKGKSKYIGETMLGFLAKITAENPQRNNFAIPHALLGNEEFYIEKCNFHKYKHGKVLSLHKPQDEFEDLISQNEKHTGKRIEFVV